MSDLLKQAQGRLRQVEINFVACCASLDINAWLLTHRQVSDAAARSMGLDLADPNLWSEMAMQVPGGSAPLHAPVPTSVLLPQGGRNEIYAFVFFSSVRDLAMTAKLYLRNMISQFYIDSPTEDESWFSSWKDFVVYTSIDIFSIPEIEAVQQVFDIDDQLFLRDLRTDKTTVMGTALFFQYRQTVSDFIASVDLMVSHDVYKKKGKVI